ASVPTIQYALSKGARVLLASHLGRPKGKPNAKMSLRPVGTALTGLLGKKVKMASDCVGTEVMNQSRSLNDGDVLLLEHLSFHDEEEANDAEFSKQLASLCDV